MKLTKHNGQLFYFTEVFKSSIVPPLRLVFLMWLIFSVQLTTRIDLGFLGIQPLTFKGAIGILFAPLIHGSISHLVSNTFPVLFLGAAVYLFYDKIASQIFLQCYFFTNILVWLFGRQHYYHIGASGLVYALASFLMFFGIFRRKMRSIIISVLVIMIYGGLIYGILPQQEYVSWESHLMGFLVGLGSAYAMRNISEVHS